MKTSRIDLQKLVIEFTKKINCFEYPIAPFEI